MSKLSVILLATLFAACTPNTSTKGQLITCATDPNSGTVLDCQPGDGGGANTCQDIDEDGDGDAHDEADDGSDDSSRATSGADDDDDDDSDDAARRFDGRIGDSQSATPIAYVVAK